MVQITQGESCTIPTGYANATVINQSQTKGGAYQITGDGFDINKQIPAGDTQATPIYDNSVVITNSGSTTLDVPDGVLLDTLFLTHPTERKRTMSLIRPENAFAAVDQTKFNVTNSTKGQLANQFILVFLTPILNSADYLYAAWQQLQPGEGGTKSFILNQTISAQAVAPDYASNGVKIPPGYVSSCTNPNGLDPVLLPPVLSGSVTPQQAGVQNNTSPFEQINVAWSVNNNLVVQSKIGLSAAAYSTFELKTTLYWAIGSKTSGANYTLQQITPMTSYSLLAGTANVDVNVTYNTVSGLYGFGFDPA